MKTCFVVSPIGEKKSVIRQRADDLFDLIIEPALERFSFEVVRADKIVGTSEITADIVDLIQNADLCIIDLTGGNPNVFYECGRRHEAGKPFVQLIAEGEPIPFDLSGIRTIPYDIDDARAVHSVSNEIREYVTKFERDGYGTESGTSIAAIAQWLQRIDRKLDRALDGKPIAGVGVRPAGTENEGIETLLKSPKERFMEAVADSRFDLAGSYLPALRERYGTGKDFIASASLVAAAGIDAGVRELANILLDEQFVAELDVELLEAVLNGYVRFHSQTDKEAEALVEMGDKIEKLANDESYPAEARAAFFNRLQMLHYGAENFEEAIRFAQKACDLNPKPSYKFNLSLNYEQAEMMVEAEKCVDEYMQTVESGQNGDHLSQAIDIYLARGRKKEAREVFQRLVEVSPSKARLKQVFDEKLQALLVEVPEGEEASDD